MNGQDQAERQVTNNAMDALGRIEASMRRCEWMLAVTILMVYALLLFS